MAVKTSWAAGDVLTAADLTDTFGSKAPLALSINAQTGTSYTLAIADSGRVVTMTNAAASTVTIPTNASVAVPIGSSVEVVNLSTGVNTTVSASGGVTFNGGPVVLSPGSSVTLVKIGTDAWMAQGQGSPGLVHIAKADMSAAASVIVNNCFSSTYEVYRLVFVSSFSADCNPYIQFRASGSDTTSNYSSRRSDLGTSYSSVTLTTGIYLGIGRNGIKTAWVFDIGSPNTASPTNLIGISEDGGAASIAAGRQTGSTQFDGFTITGGSNMTGSVYVFGYRKA